MNSFVAGVIFGAIVAGAWFFNDTLTALSGTPAFPLTASTTTPESGAVSIANQPSGQEVTVESVTVPPPGVWVAVREVSGNELGNVLGAARVNGPRTAVTIPLLRATEPGLSYAVELYRDDGDSAFDLATDSVYIDFTTSAPVIARFTTTE